MASTSSPKTPKVVSHMFQCGVENAREMVSPSRIGNTTGSSISVGLNPDILGWFGWFGLGWLRTVCSSERFVFIDISSIRKSNFDYLTHFRRVIHF